MQVALPDRFRRRNADDALALVGRLHRGILSPEEWCEGLNALAAYVGADAAGSLIWDRRSDRIVLGDHDMFPMPVAHDYHRHFQHIDPARDRLRDAPVGAIYVDQLDLGARQISESAFYREFLHPANVESVMAMTVHREQHVDWVVGFQRQRGRPLFDIENAVALRGVVTHLQTAFLLKHRMRELQAAHAWSLETLDRLAIPLLVMNAQLRVVSANSLGRDCVDREHAPAIASSADSPLRKAVAHACGDDGRPARVTTFASLAQTDGRPGLWVALPMPVRAQTAFDIEQPCALIAGIGLQAQALPAEDLLRTLFGLTRAEIALTEKLANGQTLTEAAEVASISRETARTHLKSILRKTGTRRQSELTALLAGLTVVRPG